MAKFRLHILAVAACLATALLTRAQTGIEVLPERNSFLLGEPIRLTISIKSGSADSVALATDTLGHFEVLQRLPVEISNTNGLITSTQDLIVTSFDSGRWQMPPLRAQLGGYTSPAFELEVTTLPTDSIKPYGDIKELPNLVLPKRWWHQWWVWSLLFMIIGLALGWFFSRGRKQKAFSASDPTAAALPALQQLAQLKTNWQQGNTGALLLGQELARIVKLHLATKGLVSRSQTGEELILRSKPLYKTELWLPLAQTIRFCNALQFGKYEANKSEGMTAIEAIEQLLLSDNVTEKPALENPSTKSEQPL